MKKIKTLRLHPFLVFCFVIFFLLFFLLTIFSLGLAAAGRRLIIDVVNNKPQNFESNFDSWQRWAKFISPLSKLTETLPEAVGKDKGKVYFILLQNNFELRPSGGFIGSYAKIRFLDGGLADFSVADIYVPDGQLTGHVEPPWPIQTAFKQGWWKLRDSNWEPDFPTASKQIQWFFEKGGEDQADGIIAVNFLVVKRLVGIFEPITLPDYNLQITKDNFYQITQQQVEKDFFTGSTQKTDFLSALSKQVMFELKNIKLSSLVQLIKVISTSLSEKQILLNFKNSTLQQFAVNNNWDGGVRRKYSDNDELISDYLYIVDTNLGANKANAYVERKVKQEIHFNQEGFIKEKLKINYINNSPFERPNYQDFWGGLYVNFLRLLIPIEAENIQVRINNHVLQDRIEIKEEKNKRIKSVGFFVEVAPLSETTIELEYEKKYPQPVRANEYLLEIQKQPGLDSYLHEIIISGKKPKKIEIKKDEQIKVKL